MKEKIIYIAENGKAFDNFEDCIEYEDSFLIKDSIKTGEIQLFDVDLDRIKNCDYLINCFDNAEYIYIKSKELFSKLNQKFGELGIPIIESECKEGLYEFNYDCDCWLNLNEEKRRIEGLFSKLPH